jgi:hypothetical protein
LADGSLLFRHAVLAGTNRTVTPGAGSFWRTTRPVALAGGSSFISSGGLSVVVHRASRPREKAVAATVRRFSLKLTPFPVGDDGGQADDRSFRQLLLVDWSIVAGRSPGEEFE